MTRLILTTSLLLMAAPAAAQQGVSLPDGWVLHSRVGPPSGPVAVVCGGRRAFARDWSGGVGYFAGGRWHKLPKMPGYMKGRTYGRAMAVTPDGKTVYMEASGRVGRWSGKGWTMLPLPGWRGPISGMTVLGDGELVVVGEGRVGLRRGDEIKSFDAGTWRSLRAAAGHDLGSLYLAGQGGTILRRDGKGWTRMKTGVRAWFKGLYVGRKGKSVWAWNGGRRYTRETVVLRYDGKAWSRAEQGLQSQPLGMAAADGLWAVTQYTVFRREGATWAKKITAKELGKGYHAFVGVCATKKFLYVGDSGGHSLVRRLKGSE
jgi:hypothetical protein